MYSTICKSHHVRRHPLLNAPRVHSTIVCVSETNISSFPILGGGGGRRRCGTLLLVGSRLLSRGDVFQTNYCFAGA